MVYCDWLDGDCFHPGNCDNCTAKIDAAAFDLLDYFHYTPEEFKKSSGWRFTPYEFQKVYILIIQKKKKKLCIFNYKNNISHTKYYIFKII